MADALRIAQRVLDLVPTIACPPMTLDQAQAPMSHTLGIASDNAFPIGQTFTPAASSLSEFDIGIGSRMVGSSLRRFTFQIRQWPAGGVLAEFEVNLYAGENHVVLPDGPVPLSPGEKHAILITTVTPPLPPPGTKGFQMAVAADYGGGCPVFAGAELCGPGGDIFFRTFFRP
jgi:hypothetical protein